jgi:hypothetical protein
VHDVSPCAARLITRLHAEIVSLQILAEDALTPASVQPGSRRDGGPREQAQRLLCDSFRAAERRGRPQGLTTGTRRSAEVTEESVVNFAERGRRSRYDRSGELT